MAAARAAAESAVEVAGYNLEAALAALRRSAAGEGDEPGETVPVRSPVDGRVLKLIQESAGVVASGQPLLEVGDPRRLESPTDAWQRLGDGYRVEARFVVWERPDALTVPAGALFRRDDGWAVFVVEDDRARLRQVKLGPGSGLLTEVTEGLSAGERVVVHPDDAVEDGVRVEPFRK